MLEVIFIFNLSLIIEIARGRPRGRDRFRWPSTEDRHDSRRSPERHSRS